MTSRIARASFFALLLFPLWLCAQNSGSQWFQDSDPTLPTDGKIARKPPPTSDDQDKASALINEVYSEDLKTKSSETRDSLARRFIEQGVKTEDDSAARFVLFRMAKDLSVEANDVTLALRAARAIGVYYEVDMFRLDADVLLEIGHKDSNPDECINIATCGLELADAAAANGRFDILPTLIPALKLAAARSGNTDIETLVRDKIAEYTDRQQSEAEHQAILNALHAAPDDPDKNLAAAKSYCTVKNDWVAALPLFAKGSDESLKRAAQVDLNAVRGASSPIDAANAWW
jgi:hypothetical protein